MAFCWRADDGPTLDFGLVAAISQGIRTCIARKPFSFVIFQEGWSGPPDPPSGSAHVWPVIMTFPGYQLILFCCWLFLFC